MDAVWIYWLRRNTDSYFCDSGKYRGDSTVYLVFYCVLSTERRVLHRKQYCVFRTDSVDYEKQQRAGGNGIVPFYFCIFHQPADSVRYD